MFFLSMTPQTLTPCLLPHLGPGLWPSLLPSHYPPTCWPASCTHMIPGPPAGLTSCTPCPCFPVPGPSCLEGTGFWPQGPQISSSAAFPSSLGWEEVSPWPASVSWLGLTLQPPGEGGTPTWTVDAPAALVGSHSAPSAHLMTAEASGPGCGPRPAGRGAGPRA